MYVCICKGVTENQIRDAIRGGLCTRKEISRCLKVGTTCGKCNQEVRNLLRHSLSASSLNFNSLLEEGGPRAFKLPSRLSFSESPVGVPLGEVRPDSVQVVQQAMESAACRV